MKYSAKISAITLATFSLVVIACHAQEFPFSDVIDTPTVSEAECAAISNAVWASAEWQERRLGFNVTKSAKGCIRYFPSDNAVGAKTATLFLHGDVIHNGTNTDKELYDKLGSVKAQTDLANRLAKTSGMPIVRIARPGTYGSTGMNHKWRRQPIEAHLVNAAVTKIKEKLGYDRINLAGLSGGGGLVAALLSLGRTDVNCAVIGAGATNVKLRMQHYDYLTYSKGNDATGLPLSSVYDPVDHVGEVKPDPNRRVFSVGDPRDVQVIYSSQIDYANKLRAAGTPITVLEAQAFDTNHHQVAFQAQWVAGWCSKGLTDAEMQAKLSAPRTTVSGADPNAN